MIVVVMGVSGCGKSTVGRLLASRLNFPFLDADEFHPPENVAKMASGLALSDEDRWPWLEDLNKKLKGKENAVLACSALKESYRKALSEGLTGCRFVHLRGSIELIRNRLDVRRHRFMPAALLESQFAVLEAPRGAIEIDIAQPPQRCVEEILAALDQLPKARNLRGKYKGKTLLATLAAAKKHEKGR